MSAYWPWWAGALALGTLTVAYWILLRRPLGVSGLVGRLVELGAEVAVARVSPNASEDDIASALAAATSATFGCSTAGPGSEPGPRTPTRGRPLGPRIDGVGAIAFLVALAAGGLLARLTGGVPAAGTGLGPEFERLFGGGASAGIVLVTGGALVGLGTALAEGCSTGHGLTGSARLQPGSLVSTASFLASAVAISLLVGWLAS
jgi:uncharacterized membrane protein YedE/YeeE